MTSPMLRRIHREERLAAVRAIASDALSLLGLVLLALALFSAFGCAGPQAVPPHLRPGCDFEARGACVSTSALDAGDRALLTPAAVEEAIDLGLSFWEAPPDLLDGWTLIFVDAPIADCGGAGGCVLGRFKVIEVFVRASFAAPQCARELTAPVAHEVGHVALAKAVEFGDPKHSDPRWPKLSPAVLPFLRCRGPNG